MALTKSHRGAGLFLFLVFFFSILVHDSNTDTHTLMLHLVILYPSYLLLCPAPHCEYPVYVYWATARRSTAYSISFSGLLPVFALL
jgi:hypothetical protein